MRRLGISLYPEHSTPEADDAYLELAARHGFSRIFTCLLSVKKGATETIEEFGGFISRAHDLGFVVAVDTNDRVFERLGATPTNLAPFAEMGVDIIRLDGHFGDYGDIMITRNPEGIPIEFNASSRLALDNLIARGADPRNMVTCHNFYPEPYTGLSEEIFTERSHAYRAMGLSVAAFVSSRQPDTFGPWPVFAGLPTCEDDRRRPIDLQARHLVATGLVDDIIIGNAFASEEELSALASVDLSRVTLRIDVEEGISEGERHVIWDFNHMEREDASAYLLRSSGPRIEMKKSGSVPARDAGRDVFRRGDVLVVNENMAHYLGELEIVRTEVPNDGTRNLVGRIPDEELFLLDYIRPAHPFSFVSR